MRKRRPPKTGKTFTFKGTRTRIVINGPIIDGQHRLDAFLKKKRGDS